MMLAIARRAFSVKEYVSKVFVGEENKKAYKEAEHPIIYHEAFQRKESEKIEFHMPKEKNVATYSFSVNETKINLRPVKRSDNEIGSISELFGAKEEETAI